MDSWEAIKKKVIKSFVLNLVYFIWEKSVALLNLPQSHTQSMLPFELILWDELSLYGKSY